MATARQTRERKGMEVRSANDRQKDRWGTWVARSTIVAAAAHVFVFSAWPGWTLDPRPLSAPSQVVQLIPIESFEAQTELGRGATTDLRSTERAELPRDEESDGLNNERVDLTTGYDAPAPKLAYPVLPTASNGIPGEAPGSKAMILDQMAIVRPDLAPTAPFVSWPLIRNPAKILRFLKTQYNPIHSHLVKNRYVSVAMGIDERGSVEWTEVRESSGHRMVDEIALAVFNEIVVFAPARSEGAPIAVAVVISIPFDLPW